MLCIYNDDIMYNIHSDDMKDTWHWVWWCFRTWYLMTCSFWQIFLMTSGIDHQYFKMWMSRLTSVLSRENWESCDKWWIDTLWCIPYNTTCWWSHLDNWCLDKQCSLVDHAEPQHWRTISSEEIEQQRLNKMIDDQQSWCVLSRDDKQRWWWPAAKIDQQWWIVNREDWEDYCSSVEQIDK